MCLDRFKVVSENILYIKPQDSIQIKVNIFDTIVQTEA